jgi:hypothetical protein
MAKLHHFNRGVGPLRLRGFFVTDVSLNDALEYRANTTLCCGLYLFGVKLFESQLSAPSEEGRFGIVRRLDIPTRKNA